MERKITMTPAVKPLPKQIRVAAYARVSRGTEHMLHSLAAQVSYYSQYIQNRPEWKYAGVYADADETGTRDDRPEFQRLIADCRAGQIDKIITKSISRFARNTVALLEIVRELKDLGIGVWFEEQNIDTLSGEGELMITIIAGFAQEESRSASENVKWRKRNDMKNGTTKPIKAYGYRVFEGKLVIIPEQAEVVRMIYSDYISGLGVTAITKKLNLQGITNIHGNAWHSATVCGILTNPKMCGNLVHQRHFVTDHITKHEKVNHGELPMYRIEGAHEGIISVETWNAVQEERNRRNTCGWMNEYFGLPFRKKIVCGVCGQNFHHYSDSRNAIKHYFWKCAGRNPRAKLRCNAHQILESTLIKITTDVLGLTEFDGSIFAEKIEKIVANDGRRLTFIFNDGSERTAVWEKYKPCPFSRCGKGNMSERRRKKIRETK